MKTLRFSAFLFYRYYSKGRNSIPYASTILALTLLLYIHIIQILLLINKDYLIDDFDSEHRFLSFFKTALKMLPGAFLLLLIIKKTDLQQMRYDNLKIKKGYFYLIAYIIMSVVFLVLLLFYRKGLGFKL